MPQSSVCETCVNYYKKNDPATDRHSKDIQDDFRKEIAIALAGEVVQRAICGDDSVVELDFQQDYELARCRAPYIHYRNTACQASQDFQCSACERYIDSMKEAVKQIVSRPDIKTAIENLAELLESRKNHDRMGESSIDQTLKARGLMKGSAFDPLPRAP